MSYDMNGEVFKLLMSEPFFAALSRHINKVPNKSVKTAGVRIDNDGRFEMVYNPDFMQGLIEDHRRGVLKHELYHLILEHCSVRSPDGKKISKRWNFATDLAINSHLIGELPDFCLWPKKFGYPEGQAAEWYYAKLEQDGKGGEGQCDGNHSTGEDGQGSGEPCDCGNFDDHAGWGEGGDITEDMKNVAKERLREDMRKSLNEASQQGNTWGSVPASCQKEIMRFINGTIDWKAVLRAFIGQAQKAESINTVKRINKRYPYIHAGKRAKRHANIAISIDQSGSVSDELLSMFFGELNSLSKIATFTVIPFDCGLDESKIYVWKKGKTRDTERVLNGGTDFDVPTKYVNEHNFDGHIVLTDMCAPEPKPSKCRRMWMTDQSGAQNPYFRNNERLIAISKKRA
jgi:predicted metal-dependent peptidase